MYFVFGKQILILSTVRFSSKKDAYYLFAVDYFMGATPDISIRH
jgi:hypothetical protein